jgi:AraC family transcriptional regulator
MKIDFVERPSVHVACLRYTGPFGDPLDRFWRGTVAPLLADHGVLDCPRYGVTLDDPAWTHPGKCRYDACIELPPGLSLPDAGECTIRGGRYAITAFKGTSARIGAAWTAFIGEVLANGAHHLDDARPPFEHYPRGAFYEPRSGIFACELCVAVEASS